MFNLKVTGSAVIVDRTTGRPQAIRWGGDRVSVTRLEAVRDERSAYPVGAGPRTVFVVRASARRYRLTHSLQDGQWTVEELGPMESHLPRVA